MVYEYLFGPVPSRRLGISLGVDLIPPKTCSYNCIYCESGKTTCLTTERREYVPTEKVIGELDDFLSKRPVLDYVTFAGSGEPTLHSGIRKITEFVKEKYPEYKVAILTNASLFYDKSVRYDCAAADVVVPSLDSARHDSFLKIDRPHHSLDLRKINDGIAAFRDEYNGQIWLEIFISPGINDSDAEIEAMREEIYKIRPDKIQLNTLDRPGVVSWIRPASDEEMHAAAEKLDFKNIEIAGRPVERKFSPAFESGIGDMILAVLKRRPCTLNDISNFTSLHTFELSKYLGVLEDEGKIEHYEGERGAFYRLA